MKKSFGYYIEVFKASLALILGTLLLIALTVKGFSQTVQIPCPDGYFCTIESVHDADTYKLNCNMGHNTYLHSMDIRLYGANAKELITLEGKEARDCVKMELLKEGTIVYIEFIKTRNGQEKQDKYGRLLGNVYIENKQGLDIARYLIENNYAKPYFGVGAKTKTK